MARRSVFVTRVEIYEIVKKQITYKEASDGIIIKNKKFRYDDGPQVSGEEVNDSGNPGSPQGFDPESLKALLQNPQVISLLQGAGKPVHPHEIISIKKPEPQQAIVPATNGTVLRQEFYYPDDPVWVEQARATNRGMTFTEGKRYPIMAEKMRPAANQGGAAAMGLYYDVIDDTGKKVIVSSNLFVPQIPQLENVGSGGGSGLTDKGLSWDGVMGADVPELRPRSR